ncbi:hypothetical protein T10_2037 [Trichinella papuae]|uniref:Uncharacterized protein n=1 Tax=Trichinella papuae TaxID=268474 RepID=A0A0V1N9Y7_9BILA|nr:hypothetical protein T10_2037 [Trichinella papuae]
MSAKRAESQKSNGDYQLTRENRRNSVLFQATLD